MSQKMPFVFMNEAFSCKGDVHVARVRANVESKINLLESIYDALDAPGYFGLNWDALFDCLCDLGWIGNRVVVIDHADLPRLGIVECHAYVRVLIDAIESWESSESHALKVVFPSAARADIIEALKNLS